MAVRIHVTASLASADEMRAVFLQILGPQFENVVIEHFSPWTCFSTSVWAVSSAKLIQGLEQLNAVGLQATTEDACRWYLTVIRPYHQPVTFLHRFDVFEEEWNPDETIELPAVEEIDPRLAFLQPEPDEVRPASQFDSIALDYADMGVPVAEEFLRSVQGLPGGEAVIRFQHYEVERLANVVSETGITFDRDTLTDALLWKSTTRQEQDADIGNLPRVLLALGLGGTIGEYVAMCESNNTELPLELGDNSELIDEHHTDDIEDDESIEVDDDAQQVPTEEQVSRRVSNAHNPALRRPAQTVRELSLIDQILRMADEFKLQPVTEHPVTLPLQEWPLLDFFTHAISVQMTPKCVMRIHFPEGSDAAGFPSAELKYDDLEIQIHSEEWLLALLSLDLLGQSDAEDEWRTDYLVTCLGESRARLIRRPIDGTHVEILLAEQQQPSTVLRFAGTVVAGEWQITHAFPPISASTLETALALARNQGAEEFLLESSAEAEAVMQSASRDSNLHDMDVTLDGLMIRCANDSRDIIPRHILARHILSKRLQNVWNFRPAQVQRETDYVELRLASMERRRAAVRMRQMRRAPISRDNVVFRGENSVYWQSDMSSWDKLEQVPREDFDHAMADLNFTLLGDFVCRRMRDDILRCYGSPDGLSYALIVGNCFRYSGYEFVSHFQNDAHLTTTTSWTANSRPEILVYVQHLPNATPAQLYQRHRWGISRFESQQQTLPVTLDQTLQGLVRLFDIMLGKHATVQRELQTVESVSLDDED